MWGGGGGGGSSVGGVFGAVFTPKIGVHLALAQLTNLPHFSQRLQVRIPVGVTVLFTSPMY